MDRTKEYSFVLSRMPRLHVRSRLFEFRVCTVDTNFINTVLLLLFFDKQTWPPEYLLFGYNLPFHVLSGDCSEGTQFF